MTRRTLLLVLALASSLLVSSVLPATAGSDPYRPDGWIKLCGLSNGCRIDPPPHPWKGKDIYNTTGRNQTVKVRINEGEGVRFWIAIQNDGTELDTIGVQGCSGNRTYEVRHVLVGKHRDQDPGAVEVTRKYKDGTLTFELDPGKKVFLTLQIVTHFDKGVIYRCRTELHSESDPSMEDVVVARMITY